MKTEATQPHALISVWHKNTPDFDHLVKAFHARDIQIISTGGTATHIIGLGIPVIQVSELTGFPEMMYGRVNTLHPIVFGGIIGGLHKFEDIKAMRGHDIPLIDYVVVNLYPFQEEVDKGSQTTHDNIIEKIDVGGPSMIRAAAKNHDRVSVICDPEDYRVLANLLESGEKITLQQREEWAQRAFAITANYDKTIAEYLSNQMIKNYGK
jgi:phosphoribosylaminoimidazolecarboxamide formyltransferase/IMP cyclohydrolase